MVEKVTSVIVLHPNTPASHVSAFVALLHVLSPAPRKFVVKRFVLDAVVAKKLVEVLFEVVELTPVKFWRVVEPVTRRLLAVKSPDVLSEPKVAAVANKLVEVAFVVVPFVAVKFWRVVEPRAFKVPDGKM